MLVIGLTGGIGSGKTTVANMFAALGIPIVDSDLIAREVVAPGTEALEAIVKRFGTPILLPDGLLDRRQLRNHIFTHSAEKQWLEKLLHPLIQQELSLRIQQMTAAYCIAIIPLLFETDKTVLVNRILVVDTTEELQWERVQQRDQQSQTEVQNIQKQQASRKHRLAGAHDIIQNTGSLEELQQQVLKLHQHYLGLAHS